MYCTQNTSVHHYTLYVNLSWVRTHLETLWVEPVYPIPKSESRTWQRPVIAVVVGEEEWWLWLSGDPRVP